MTRAHAPRQVHFINELPHKVALAWRVAVDGEAVISEEDGIGWAVLYELEPRSSQLSETFRDHQWAALPAGEPDAAPLQVISASSASRPG